jgi:hypothetical protein
MGTVISETTVKKVFIRFSDSMDMMPSEAQILRENPYLTLSQLRAERFYQMTPSEQESAKRKGLSQKQWKMREIFRMIFEEEFFFFKEREANYGRHVSCAGLTLKERMDVFPQIAKDALDLWISAFSLEKLNMEVMKGLQPFWSNPYMILTRMLQEIEG